MRDYAKGVVLVNPAEKTVPVPDLGAPYRLVTASGGGPVGEDGRAPGSLGRQVVSSVTVPAHSARVLLSGKGNHARRP